MLTHALYSPSMTRAVQRAPLVRPMDLLVAVVGLAITGCGFFATEMRWLLMS